MNVSNKFGDWSELGGFFSEIHKLNQGISEKMIREYISFCSDQTSTVMKCMQTLPRTTDPEDFVSTQMKFMSEHSEKVLGYAQNMFQIYQEALKQYFSFAEGSVNTVLKSNLAKTKKPAE